MTTSELVFEDTEFESVKLGRDSSGEPRTLKIIGNFSGDMLRGLDNLLLSRGIDFAPAATWVASRDGSMQHAVERYTPKELTVGDLREKLARVPSTFSLGVMLQSAGVGRVGIVHAYPDTTDEFGKFGKGTFKLAVHLHAVLRGRKEGVDLPLRVPDGVELATAAPATVGTLRQGSCLQDADTRVVLADGGRSNASYRTIQLASRSVHVVGLKIGEHDVTFQTLPRAVKS
jgi:hypothetical protein